MCVFDTLAQQMMLPPEEIARLETPSEHPCPICGKAMSVGEYEAAGVCTDCYFKEVAQ